MIRLATDACGTRFELVLDGDGPGARAVGEEALAEIEEVDRRFSRFRRDSLVAHLSREAALRPVRVDDDTFELLEECARVHALSGGAFDPTVGAWMDELGFHEREGDGAPDGPARVGMQLVRLDAERRTVSFAAGGLRLDLGAIAKGHALDLAGRVLREEGVERALIHGGRSSILAIGAPPDADAWRVAVETRGHGRIPVRLRDRALAVSAQHGRTLLRAGERLGHVLDPRTGAPARTPSTVAVVGPRARAADAWATATLVLGAPAPDGEGQTTMILPAAGDPAAQPLLSGPEPHLFEVGAAPPSPAES